MWEDPIVKEVRLIREELTSKFNFDVSAIFNDLRKRQQSLGSRLVHLEKKKDISKDTHQTEHDSTSLHPGR